jgi:hemerythrin-like domain-containing protein
MKLKDLLPKEILPSGTEDAIDMLKADHDKVKELIERFEEIKGGRAVKEKANIVREACKELRVHAALEEQVFYPAARRAIDDDDLMNEATVEHTSAKDLIRQLESMTPADEMFAAKFTVLGEYINHHVREEENEMFPKVRKSDIDLDALGQKMAARKAQLMREPAAKSRKAATSRKSPKKRSR